MNLAIIPARGGSKRIPRKNIKPFLGDPIIAYSIRAAIESNLFDKIIVSTDDEEISEVAKKFGADVWLRSDKNSDDYATISDVVVEVLNTSKDKGMVVENFALFYSTAPLVRVKDVVDSFKLLDADSDVVLPVVAYSYPVQRSLKMNDRELLEFSYPEYKGTRSQDLEKIYHDSGTFFWSKAEFFLKEKNLFNGRTKAHELDEILVQDIDTTQDWEIAEFKYNYLKEKGII